MLATVLGYTEPHLVTTVQGGQTGISFPFAPIYEATQLKLVRPNLFLQALSVANGVMIVEVCIQLSDDGVSWPTSTSTPISFATAVTKNAEGQTAITAFEDIASLLTKKYARFVVFVKNTAGNTGLATCLASIRIERRSC